MNRTLLTALLASTLAIHGCETVDEIAGPDTIEPGPVYPQGQGQAGVLDIQVFRDETVLLLTNTTSQTFPDGGRFWVNAQYSMPFERFDIGETKRVDLRNFVNEFGERFRAGGFFATVRPDDVVLVQIEHAGRIDGLIVVENAGE